MGNTNSKTRVRDSTSSTTPLNMAQMNFPRSPGVANLAAYDPQERPCGANEVIVTSFAGDEPENGEAPQSTITHPTPARPLIRRYSELLDPALLEDQQVRSPSGNLLSRSTFDLRSDRPLSMRERQEKIRQHLEQKKQEQMAEAQRAKRNPFKRSAGTEAVGKKEKHRGCLGCFGI